MNVFCPVKGYFAFGYRSLSYLLVERFNLDVRYHVIGARLVVHVLEM